MLMMSGWRSSMSGKVAGVAVVCLVGALSASCGLVPQHPDDGALVVGFRVTDRTVEVKVPMCPGDKLSRVEVWDPGSETKKEKLLWWGERPIAEGSDDGLLRLWSPADYRKSSAAQQPPNLPPLIDVSATYADQEDSVGDLISLDEAGKEEPDEYWTIKGKSMSAREIDDQLTCSK
ncbi:hypothetical protein ACFYW1_34150 [Streptomyces sp. NPDC002669]|uniref:hypothetical protein n=1 Tax=unclassified Streptomyces TaxID=2593676 RepID=UPI0036974455